MSKIQKGSEIILYLALHLKDYYNVIDCDNVAKSLCDAFQGHLYEKDSQIKLLICEKFRAKNKINEGVVVAFR
ncbi:RusA family crossover junction endodeoxyribonuclease [Candidatus Woesearchaeota archaeon]|nr:RusA family crossover junction endodeoxyribonuclease [Candidatus Woesearchaeota archaeon]